jgi:DNA-binding transcriptional MerR regulator
MSLALMKIGELATRAGVNQRTIHFYEGLGLIQPAHREGGGYRYFDQASVERLELISRLKAIGLSLDEIREVLPIYASDASGVAGKKRVIEILRAHLSETNEQIERLTDFRDELITNITKLEVFLAQALDARPSAKTAIQIAKPQRTRKR